MSDEYVNCTRQCMESSDQSDCVCIRWCLLLINVSIFVPIITRAAIRFSHYYCSFNVTMGLFFHHLVCNLEGFLKGVTGLSSIFTLTAISVVRYRMVVLNAIENLSRKSVQTYIIALWIWCAFWSFLPIVNIGEFVCVCVLSLFTYHVKIQYMSVIHSDVS